MHGFADKSPYQDNGNSWTFTFKGRRPNSTVYTIESIVTVSKDGKQVSVNYNGGLRRR